MATYRVFPAEVLAVLRGNLVVCDIDLGFGIIMRQQAIRILGIDTPELNTPEGVAARDYLESMLKGVEKLTLMVKDNIWRDKDGRCLGTLSAKSVCLGTAMVHAGHATNT